MDIAAALVPILAAHPARPDALLPILHDVQDACGHIPDAAVPVIAKALNLSRAEVHGVVSYYAHFREEPPGFHVVRVCRGEACQAVGGAALAAHAAERLHDGDLTLEPVYCLGLCALGPAVQIDETTLHAHVTPEKFDALIDDLDAAS
ncbi:MAG: NAD(P)H-dependent oxidoreductase subunit E [Rhodocyclales bacterium]|nr:NAD(P)H-dependent oxidoreductase subunit E [Rhodocyclales bacterium]